MRIDAEVPVLIVGGGPTGLMLSALLSQQGVESLLVEAHESTCDHPQGHVINARTCEILRGLDCERDLIDAADLSFGMAVRFMTALSGNTLATFSPARDRSRVAARLSMSPSVPLSCPQDLLEPVLAGKAAQGPGKVRFSSELLELQADDAGVTATVRCGGQTERIRCNWLIGCDGAGSPTRRTLGISMEGPESLARVVGVYFQADLSEWLGDKPAVLYWTIDDQCPATVINMGHNRWVAHIGWNEEAQPLASFTDERCGELVHRIVGADAGVRICSVRPWTMTAQVAASYRQGRVLLAGDAAHRFPPTGGFGLNTGMQDAHNLAWKLALVEWGFAGESLLDTYEVERKPVAVANSDFSLRNAVGMGPIMGAGALAQGRRLTAGEVTLGDLSAEIQSLLCKEAGHFDAPGREFGYVYGGAAVVGDGSSSPEVEDPDRDYVQSARPGARAPHMWIELAGERRSTIDLFSERFTLLTSPALASDWRAAAQSVAVAVLVLAVGADLQCDMQEWERLYGATTVLVRPDGHVAWRSSTPNENCEATLHEILARVLGVEQVGVSKKRGRGNT